ncbi:MAG: cyclic nucleotide-binding domain-containing protein [Candidatus Eisenbacteria bacterium]
MKSGALGRVYENGEVIVQEGDAGDSMYVIQEGQVEVVAQRGGGEVRLRILGAGEFLGEMAIFEREVRSATVRALGQARILTVDKKNFLKRIHEDPSMAFRVVEMLSRRIRDLTNELVRLKGEGGGP